MKVGSAGVCALLQRKRCVRHHLAKRVLNHPIDTEHVAGDLAGGHCEGDSDGPRK